MRHYYLLILLFIQIGKITYAQNNAPGIVWQRTIGAGNTEVLTSMIIGPDKSIVLCGYSNSSASGNKTSDSFGGNDYWVVKLDSTGNVLWNNTYGGNDDDKA